MKLLTFKRPIPEAAIVKWDGHSPINGEPVLSRLLDVGGRDFVFTKTCCYELHSESQISGGVEPSHA